MRQRIYQLRGDLIERKKAMNFARLRGTQPLNPGASVRRSDVWLRLLEAVPLLAWAAFWSTRSDSSSRSCTDATQK
jgi:hypothetical protein